MKKTFLQRFADASATKGSRIFMSESLPLALEDIVIGVMTTGDKGSEPNKIEATTISDTSDKEVLGTQGVTNVEFEFLLSDTTLTKQLELIGKEVWVHEEYEDSSSDASVIHSGIVQKIKLGGLTATGQTVNELRKFTQSGTMISQSYYYAKSSGTGTFTYTDMVTGATVTLS